MITLLCADWKSDTIWNMILFWYLNKVLYFIMVRNLIFLLFCCLVWNIRKQMLESVFVGFWWVEIKMYGNLLYFKTMEIGLKSIWLTEAINRSKSERKSRKYFLYPILLMLKFTCRCLRIFPSSVTSKIT